MNPREAALLSAAATLLSTKQDVAYGPADAVRDALALEQEIAQQLPPPSKAEQAVVEMMDEFFGDRARKSGAL